MFIAAKGIK